MTQNPAPASLEPGGSQAFKAQMMLRQMVLAGHLPAGSRIAELSLVEKLGMSRTPIRTALMRLEQEGLLEALPNGGFAVRLFSERDVLDAIELRGVVEGLSARVAAERGVPPLVLTEARNCLDKVDALLASTALDDEAFSRYEALNERFHVLLSELSGSKIIGQELERVSQLPFASPSVFVLAQANSPHARDMLMIAQYQHRQVLEAITQREGARAEAIMREHSRLAQHNLHEALRMPDYANKSSVHLIRKLA